MVSNDLSQKLKYRSRHVTKIILVLIFKSCHPASQAIVFQEEINRWQQKKGQRFNMMEGYDVIYASVQLWQRRCLRLLKIHRRIRHNQPELDDIILLQLNHLFIMVLHSFYDLYCISESYDPTRLLTISQPAAPLSKMYQQNHRFLWLCNSSRISQLVILPLHVLSTEVYHIRLYFTKFNLGCVYTSHCCSSYPYINIKFSHFGGYP